jgi:hypothetical protein
VSESPYREPAPKPVSITPPSPARTEWFPDREQWALIAFGMLVVAAIRFVFWMVMHS